MTTLTDSLVSSSARKLTIRRRPDLMTRRQRYHGRSYWVVKDPVGLHYFRFQEEEYAILQMLDGETSLDEIKDRFEAEFPPQKIALEELQQFLGMLHRSGLILVSVQGQGEQLLKRRRERRRTEILGAFANILSIRFKGIDPERLLNGLYPWVRWLFSRTAFGLSMALMVGALFLVLVQFKTFESKLPEFQQFFSPANAFLLALVLGSTKVLHEFGHGLSCKHFGGECHEMGLMLLVLTPCLYCNVSDSWMLPNKWHRAAIGAAGIYVEVVLASVATFLWWYSSPGLMNMLCLNVMFISSASTIIFNANPLLRYDGYYILADVLEIPNLRQKATSILNRKMGEWLLGLEPTEDPFLPERHQVLFAFYSVAAAIYRWVVLFSILWFLYQIWKPYRLEIIGYIIGAISVGGLIIRPLYQLGKFFYVPGRWNKVKKPRMYASLTGVAAILAFVLFVPLPYSVIAPLEIQPHKADEIYAKVSGRLVEVRVKPGDRVVKGQVLARMESDDLDFKIAELKGQRDLYKSHLDTLRWQRLHAAEAASSIPEALEMLHSKEEQLREREMERARLTLRAGRDGTVMPPPETPPRDDPDGPLPTWSGLPLDRENLGATLEEGSLICLVGDPKQMEAILVIDQADIPFCTVGQKVALSIDEIPHDTLHGEITDISPGDLKVSSRRLAAKYKGELATKQDPTTGAEKPMSTSYQAKVPLDDGTELLRLGLRGRARIYMDQSNWQSLGQRVWRLLTRTFNFRM
jgi:putative peptide zinc metalloprotease protein